MEGQSFEVNLCYKMVQFNQKNYIYCVCILRRGGGKYLRLEQHKVKQEGEEVVSGSDGCQHIRQFGLCTSTSKAIVDSVVVWQFF